MVSNRNAGITFRREVVHYLLRQGVAGAHDPWESKRLSELIGDPTAHTDIAGLGPWAVDVRSSSTTFDISKALNDAREKAALFGSDWYAAIQNRRGYPIEDTFCVVPLNVMARLFAGEVPTKLRA